jgi:anti-anti-sigma factor
VTVETLKIEAVELGATLRVRLSGEFDLVAYKEVDELLANEQMNGRHDVIVDLRGLSFIDSSGIRALLQANMRAEEVGGRLRLIPGPDNVRRVFELAGLDEKFEFVESG